MPLFEAFQQRLVVLEILLHSLEAVQMIQNLDQSGLKHSQARQTLHDPKLATTVIGMEMFSRGLITTKEGQKTLLTSENKESTLSCCHSAQHLLKGAGRMDWHICHEQ